MAERLGTCVVGRAHRVGSRLAGVHTPLFRPSPIGPHLRPERFHVADRVADSAMSARSAALWIVLLAVRLAAKLFRGFSDRTTHGCGSSAGNCDTAVHRRLQITSRNADFE